MDASQKSVLPVISALRLCIILFLILRFISRNRAELKFENSLPWRWWQKCLYLEEAIGKGVLAKSNISFFLSTTSEISSFDIQVAFVA